MTISFTFAPDPGNDAAELRDETIELLGPTELADRPTLEQGLVECDAID